MAAKWLGEWQLTPEEILAACDETVKATNPSFAYLDKIIESSRQNDGSFDAVKELLETLGNYQKPNRSSAPGTPPGCRKAFSRKPCAWPRLSGPSGAAALRGWKRWLLSGRNWA